MTLDRGGRDVLAYGDVCAPCLIGILDGLVLRQKVRPPVRHQGEVTFLGSAGCLGLVAGAQANRDPAPPILKPGEIERRLVDDFPGLDLLWLEDARQPLARIWPSTKSVAWSGLGF